MAADDAPKEKDVAKWQKALLKKLRSAVGVKARIDGGDTKSLQKSQVSKGQRKTIREILSSLKEAGLDKDAKEVEAAMAAGNEGGKAAMAAAEVRGPDGGADGTTPSKKSLKREQMKKQREEQQKQMLAGGGAGAGSTPGKASTNAATTPGVSGHQFAACKRAVLALHALAKDPTSGSTTPPATTAGEGASGDVADVTTAALRALTIPLTAAADARLASTALWAVAKIAARARAPSSSGATADTTTTTAATTTTADADDTTAAVTPGAGDAEAVSALATALASRAGAVAHQMDARGLSTTLWALATFAATKSSAASGGGEVLINRSTYQVKPFYLSSETVLPIR
jgi:hypothetical protein